MVIRPGRPFWSAFTAFFASMTSLFGMDQLSLTTLDVQVNLLGALVVSLFVSAVVYGQEKLADFRKATVG